MKRLIIILALLVGGCGSGGGEETQVVAAAAPETTTESMQEAGAFVASVPATGGDYKTTTTKGEFITLTRIGASAWNDKRAVVMTYTSNKTGEISSQWVRVYLNDTLYDVESAKVIRIVSLLP